MLRPAVSSSGSHSFACKEKIKPMTARDPMHRPHSAPRFKSHSGLSGTSSGRRVQLGQGDACKICGALRHLRHL